MKADVKFILDRMLDDINATENELLMKEIYNNAIEDIVSLLESEKIEEGIDNDEELTYDDSYNTILKERIYELEEDFG